MPEGTKHAQKPVLALKPMRAPGNSFAGLFSDHIDGESFERVQFDWEQLGRGSYDIVLFHWPTEFFRPASRKTTLELLGRMLRDKVFHGTRFVWVAHNLEPHDGGSLKSGLTAYLFLKLLDGVIVLSEHSRRELHRLYPATRSIATLVTVHGRYDPVADPPRDARPSERRNRLLFFGLIREYKNVERLVAEARKVTTTPFSLTVVGACRDEDLARRIRAAAGDDRRIRLDLRREFVPDDELERVIDAHDAVVLPYRNILNSGVALHSLGRNKPLLAPRIGSLPELQEMVGADWVHLFDGEISSASLESFLAALSTAAAPHPDLSPFDWDRVGAGVTRFLKSLIARPASIATGAAAPQRSQRS
jgi:beta-1,4-mannosyltransferase